MRRCLASTSGGLGASCDAGLAHDPVEPVVARHITVRVISAKRDVLRRLPGVDYIHIAGLQRAHFDDGRVALGVPEHNGLAVNCGEAHEPLVEADFTCSNYSGGHIVLPPGLY